MKEDFAHVNGIKLHFVEEGSGEAVVLLHGFPEFWYGWRNQIPELSQHYRVGCIGYARRGPDDKPENVSDYNIDVLAADIADLVRALNLKQVILVGHDWGAAVAWATAALYPKTVSKLAILNVPHPAEMKKP
ncbi:MAG: alpha/beta fold hydrolase [Chitinophagales bacterium]